MKVISGGQTGADIAGLKAAKSLNIPTGGYAPKGYLTEKGSTPELADYGIKCLITTEYPPRTRRNVNSCDVTIIFNDQPFSRGCKLTESECKKQEKPCLEVTSLKDESERILNFLKHNSHQVINIAGNRESSSPGIENRVVNILITVFKQLIEDETHS